MKDSLIYTIGLYQDLSLHPPIAISRSHMKRYSYISSAGIYKIRIIKTVNLPKFGKMGRTPCCSKVGLNRGAWTALEDRTLTDYIRTHGEGKWRKIPKEAGECSAGIICQFKQAL